MEPSWDATSHGSFVDCLAGCIIVDPLGLRYLLKSVVLHRSIGGEGFFPKLLPTAFCSGLSLPYPKVSDHPIKVERYRED